MADDAAAPTPERLSARLETRWLGRAYEWHASCASTNDLAGARAREGAAAGLVVATEQQTAGRGRLGRVWHSPAGENLYLSIVLRPTRPAAEIPPLTLLAGAAVARALGGLGVRPRLKWPNDVLLLDEAGVARKVAGILTEMSSEGGRVGHVVVGLGLNVNAAAFPSELVARATSLRLAAGRPFDRAVVLAAVLGTFEPLYDDFQRRGPAAAIEGWQEFAALGERCRVNASGDAIEGVALGVDADGALRVRDDLGHIHRVLSGEILDMTSIEAIVLGIVQGVTEFLPISSTAHLRVVPALVGWPDPGAAFTAVLQLGSLAAVIGYFLKDLSVMAGAAMRAVLDWSKPPEPAALQLLYIVIGTIPVGLAGILLKHRVEGSFRALWVIATAQIVVGLAMAVVEKTSSKTRSFDDIKLRDAVIIGCAQMLALVPGVSRSGITLLAAMYVGLERPAAARFSFLLSVPAVAAAGLFELPKVLKSHDVGGVPLALGLVAAVIASYASIAWLLKFLRTRTTIPFVVYRVALGILIFGMLAAGRL